MKKHHVGNSCMEVVVEIKIDLKRNPNVKRIVIQRCYLKVHNNLISKIDLWCLSVFYTCEVCRGTDVFLVLTMLYYCIIT